MSMWTYTTIYRAVIQYIQSDLRMTNLQLNFGVIAIATRSPRVLMRFTLTNPQISKKETWTVVLSGETVEGLIQAVRESVAPHRESLQ